MTRTPPPEPTDTGGQVSPRGTRDAGARDRAPADRSEVQPALPLDLDAVAPLPYDDEAERPLGLVLTARGRRAIAAADLPDLQVVPDPAPGPVPAPAAEPAPAVAPLPIEEDPSDTRPSRARALRRAGRSPARIAEQLEVDELLVRAWVADVAPFRGRRRRVVTEEGPAAEHEGAERGVDDEHERDLARARARHPSAGARHRRTVLPGAGVRDDGLEEQRTSFQLARAAACQEAHRSRLRDPAFAAGVGLVAGTAEFDPHAVTMTTSDPELASAVLSWVRQQMPVEEARIRVVLRVGPRGAGDLAAHRWARALAVDRGRVAVTTWRNAPAEDAEQVLLRIADPTVAATLAGWRDALLHPSGSDPADVAF